MVMMRTSSYRRAFSLLEAVVVVSIVALVVSIAYPALAQAIRSAKHHRSLSQMRQIHAALMIYVEEQQDEGLLGLGLPPSLLALVTSEKLPIGILQTGGSSWKDPLNPPRYTWMPPHLVPGEESHLGGWREYVQATGRNPVVVLDETFSPTTGWFDRKRATGLFFDGHLETRWARGSLSNYNLWR